VLRLGILGAGIMGTNHARVARALRDASVSAVVDPSSEKGEALADWAGAEYFNALEPALEHIDAAIVAVPTPLHVDVALQVVEAGIPVLVEKPLCSNLQDGEKLVKAADAAEVSLATGHVERFNPAIIELEKHVGEILHFHAERVSPFSPRVSESVIFDLMIHDLDIALTLTGSSAASISAVTRKTSSDTADIALALIEFENGTVASFIASRAGQNKIRQLEITQKDGFLSVDLLRQDVTINRVEHVEFLSEAGSRYRQSGVVEIPFLEHQGEPLFLQLEDFVGALTSGSPPKVSGADGLKAIEVALAVSEAASARSSAE
jgi:predicted dehydrogenase